MSEPAALEAIGVTRRIDGATIVDHVDLVAVGGRLTAIIGPNGAGKTTLLNCLSGVDQPDEGTVLLGGIDVTDASSDRRARLGLGRTFQHSSVFPTLSVTENLRVAGESARRRWVARGLLGIPDPDARRVGALVDDVLDELGLRALRTMRAGTLPTGTLRLVELARAMCTKPKVLLLDEPASGLTNVETEALHLLLHRLARRGLALVMIEHDLELVGNVADTIVVMTDGRVVASGTRDDIGERSDLRDLVIGIGRAP